MKRKDILKELEQVQTERIKNWRTIQTKEIRFFDHGQQRQYEMLGFLLEILEVMSDKEFHELTERVKRNEELNKSQKGLF